MVKVGKEKIMQRISSGESVIWLISRQVGSLPGDMPKLRMIFTKSKSQRLETLNAKEAL